MGDFVSNHNSYGVVQSEFAVVAERVRESRPELHLRPKVFRTWNVGAGEETRNLNPSFYCCALDDGESSLSHPVKLGTVGCSKLLFST